MFSNNTTKATIETILTATSIPGTISAQIDYFQRSDWIGHVAINIVLLVLSIWVLISVIHYGIKTKKWSQVQASNEEKLNTRLIYTSVVICATACLIQYILSLFYFNIGYSYKGDRLCDIFSDLLTICYAFVLFSSVLFSWSRQRLFYSNRMLNVYYTKAVRFFSQSSIVIIVVGGLGVVVFKVVPDDHQSSPEGCTHEVASNSLRIAYWISIVFAIGFGQITVLCLFVHALRSVRSSTSKTQSRIRGGKDSTAVSTGSDHFSISKEHVSANGRKKNKKIHVQAVSDVGKSQQSIPTPSRSLSNTDHINRIIRNTFIFATISLVVDILIQAFSFFISSGNRSIVNTFLNISAFLNLMLIVFAFKHYKRMLFCCCDKK